MWARFCSWSDELRRAQCQLATGFGMRWKLRAAKQPRHSWTSTAKKSQSSLWTVPRPHQCFEKSSWNVLKTCKFQTLVFQEPFFWGVVKARTPIFRVLCWGPQNSFLMFPLCFDSNFYIIGFFEIALIPESTRFHTKMCLNMKEFIISWHAFFLV